MINSRFIVVLWSLLFAYNLQLYSLQQLTYPYIYKYIYIHINVFKIFFKYNINITHECKSNINYLSKTIIISN